MHPVRDSLVAAIGVFCGSLIWDAVFGDGIQFDDVFQAITVGVVAAIIQLWFYRRRK